MVNPAVVSTTSLLIAVALYLQTSNQLSECSASKIVEIRGFRFSSFW